MRDQHIMASGSRPEYGNVPKTSWIYDASNHGFYFDPNFGGDTDDVRIEGGIFEGQMAAMEYTSTTRAETSQVGCRSIPDIRLEWGYGINSTNTSGGAVTRGFITGFSFFQYDWRNRWPARPWLACCTTSTLMRAYILRCERQHGRDHAGTAYTRSGGSWVANV